MKKLVKKILTLSVIAFVVFQISGCKKDCAEPSVDYPIKGLWIGTFTTVSGFAEPPGTDFYFSFSIYPDGTLSYKSGSNANRYVYGEGTWSLNGTNFSFLTKTINAVTSNQVNVTGSALFDKSNGTLTNGTVTTTTPISQATWKMNRVN